MKKPNVLFILSDDQGYWSMGCAGNPDVKTPTLDRLSREGVTFDNFFCASPVCSPARASIITGKMPSVHGIQDWIAHGHVDKAELSDDLILNFDAEKREWFYDWPKNQLDNDSAIDFLDGMRCYTEELAENGYNCGVTGKWHMGNAGKPQKGFSYWHTLAMGGENYMYPVVRNMDTGKFEMLENVYSTDWITGGALDFLDTLDEDKPFYLAVNYNAPHAPWQKQHHKSELWDAFEGASFDSFPKDPLHEWAKAPLPSDKERLEWIRGYCAALYGLDLGAAEILKKLEDKGLLEDTIVIFTADNGMSMGHHGFYGKGNGTFPMNMYETSVKVPTIIRVPEKLGGHSFRCGELLSHYDLYPTILELCGITPNRDDMRPGRSFAKLLTSDEPGAYKPNDEIIVMSEYGPARMIRTKEWKYIRRYPYGPHELYDIAEDPGETVNLFGRPEYSALTEDLKYRMERWFERYTDPKRDGRLEENHGLGQTGRVGLEAKGKTVFR